MCAPAKMFLIVHTGLLGELTARSLDCRVLPLCAAQIAAEKNAVVVISRNHSSIVDNRGNRPLPGGARNVNDCVISRRAEHEAVEQPCRVVVSPRNETGLINSAGNSVCRSGGIERGDCPTRITKEPVVRSVFIGADD